MKVRISKPGPPPRRQPHRTLVTIVALATVFVATVVMGTFAWLAFVDNRHHEADADRKQQFVDTASQTVVNMFSYNQNNIDDSVNRFVNGTSGPLRDMMSQGNNVDNLKAIFHDTQANSEAVINGAFTVPGDGSVDFAALIRVLRDHGYRGWLVVEAEQDPVVAPSYAFAEKGFRHLRDLVARTN